MKFALYLLSVYLIFGCSAQLPVAEKVSNKNIIKEAIVLRWEKRSSKNFSHNSSFDTITLRYDSLGKLTQQITKYKDIDKYTTDSISYDYAKSDTLPDWQVFTKITNDYHVKYSGVHDFDDDGYILSEHLIYKDNPELYKNKVHHYDTEMNSMGHTVYNYAHIPTEKVTVEFDSLNKAEIRTTQRFQPTGDVISTSIDSNFIIKNRLSKQKKWTDWKNRKYYNKLPKCYVCEITYGYDIKGRLSREFIDSYEGKGQAEIQYYYDNFDHLISKSEVVNRDTTLFKYYRENDTYGNYIIYKEYKNDILIKYLQRKIIYWEE